MRLHANRALVLLLLGSPIAFAGDASEFHSHSRFGGEAVVDLPLRDLKESLDNRTGLGLGVHWTHLREGSGHASRTRLEWNVYPEGHAVGNPGVSTQASNYTLSFDHLYHFQGEPHGVYILGGLGAIRWFTDQTVGDVTHASHTTKLGVTAGLGWRFNSQLAVESRYVVSSLDRTFDANSLQMAVSWSF